MKRPVLCLFIFLLFCIPCFAERLSLAQLIDIALKNNPETEKAWWSAKRAQAALGQAKSDYYPSLNGKANAAHGREVKFPNGPNTTYTNYSGELSLDYLLFDFGERNAQVSAAKEALKAADWTSDFAIQRIMYKVSAHYYEYLNAVELLKTKECSLQDASTIAKSAEELYKAGLRAVTDIHSSKAAMAQAQMEAAQHRALVSIAYGKLLTSLGLPVETAIEVETDPEGIKNPLFSEGIPKLISVAGEQRTDLLAKQASLAEMKYRVQKESRSMWPKLHALGQAGYLQYTKHKGSGYNYLAGLSLDIPMFNGFERIYSKRLAYAQAEMTQTELKELYESIALEVLTQSASVKAANEALQWSDEFLSQANQSYSGSLESYKAGLQNIFDLLQTQRYLADARMKKAQARTQWLVSLAELAFATGSMIQ